MELFICLLHEQFLENLQGSTTLLLCSTLRAGLLVVERKRPVHVKLDLCAI